MKLPAPLALLVPPGPLVLSLRAGVSLDFDIPKLRFDTRVSEASSMMFLRSFLAGIIGEREPQGAAEDDVVFGGVERFIFTLLFRPARDSVGDSATGLLLSGSEDNICPSR